MIFKAFSPSTKQIFHSQRMIFLNVPGNSENPFGKLQGIYDAGAKLIDEGREDIQETLQILRSVGSEEANNALHALEEKMNQKKMLQENSEAVDSTDEAYQAQKQAIKAFNDSIQNAVDSNDIDTILGEKIIREAMLKKGVPEEKILIDTNKPGLVGQIDELQDAVFQENLSGQVDCDFQDDDLLSEGICFSVYKGKISSTIGETRDIAVKRFAHPQKFEDMQKSIEQLLSVRNIEEGLSLKNVKASFRQITKQMSENPAWFKELGFDVQEVRKGYNDLIRAKRTGEVVNYVANIYKQIYLRKFQSECNAITIWLDSAITEQSVKGKLYPNQQIVNGVSNGERVYIEPLAAGDLCSAPKEESESNIQSEITQTLQRNIQAAHELAHFHEQGLVHRDIKPENFLVQQDGSIQLSGFKIAANKDALPDSPRKASGVIDGSAPYLSPELLTQEYPTDKDERFEIYKKSDVYAFAVGVYFQLTGFYPNHFDADAVSLDTQSEAGAKKFQQIIAQRMKKRTQQNASIYTPNTLHPSLQKVLKKALSPNPNDHYKSMNDLVHDLERVESTMLSQNLQENIDQQSEQSFKEDMETVLSKPEAMVKNIGILKILSEKESDVLLQRIIASYQSRPQKRSEVFQMYLHKPADEVAQISDSNIFDALKMLPKNQMEVFLTEQITASNAVEIAMTHLKNTYSGKNLSIFKQFGKDAPYPVFQFIENFISRLQNIYKSFNINDLVNHPQIDSIEQSANIIPGLISQQQLFKLEQTLMRIPQKYGLQGLMRELWNTEKTALIFSIKTAKDRKERMEKDKSNEEQERKQA